MSLPHANIPMSLWRTTVFRLTLAYTLALLVGVFLLLSFIYWQGSLYLEKQSDDVVLDQKAVLSKIPIEQLEREIVLRDTRYLLGVNYFSLFTADKHYLAGNIADFPDNVRLEAKPVPMTAPGYRVGARVLATRLSDGRILLIAYNTHTLMQLRHIIAISLCWGGSIVIFGGLIVGGILSRKPMQRLRLIKSISEKIQAGDFTQRLPLTSYHDELDAFSALVNQMIANVEHLLGEIKSVGDNIAHDLRTPLNQVRGHLYRLNQDWTEIEDREKQVKLEHALAATDTLLVRFKALQRIAEIDSRARNAGMSYFAAEDFADEISAFFTPVFAEKEISLAVEVIDAGLIFGDRELLMEALFNLLDNAYKFTPAHGRVSLILDNTDDRLTLMVEDSGPGIPPEQRANALMRFGRDHLSSVAAGTGLGLAIVAAIANIHHLSLKLESAQPGLRVILQQRAR